VLFATSAGAARGGDLRGGNRTDLADLIRAQEQKVADSTRNVEALRRDVADATKIAAAADQRIGTEQRKSKALNAAAGLQAVHGPGLRVTLSDAPRSADRLLPQTHAWLAGELPLVA